MHTRGSCVHFCGGPRPYLHSHDGGLSALLRALKVTCHCHLKTASQKHPGGRWTSVSLAEAERHLSGCLGAHLFLAFSVVLSLHGLRPSCMWAAFLWFLGTLSPASVHPQSPSALLAALLLASQGRLRSGSVRPVPVSLLRLWNFGEGSSPDWPYWGPCAPGTHQLGLGQRVQAVWSSPTPRGV